MVKVWQIAIATLLIYAAGVFTGGALIKVASPPQVAAPVERKPETPNRERRDRGKEFLDFLARKLELTGEQREQVELILRESQDRMRKRIGPIAKEEHELTQQQLMSQLTPDQQEKAKEVFKKGFFRGFGGPGGPGGPGPDGHSRGGDKGKDAEKHPTSGSGEGVSRPGACNADHDAWFPA